MSETSNLNEPKIKRPLKPSRQWLILITIRIVLNLFSQRSYIHPDEFFQGVEIISGDLFNCPDKIFRAWEFQFKNDQEPIRNMAIPYIFYGIPLYILKLLSNIGSIKNHLDNPNNLPEFNLVTIQANSLIYYPRLFMTLFSIIIDYCLFKISVLCDFDYTSVLLTFSSSYITHVYLTRTFSNSIETIFFTILIYFVIKSIKAQYVLDERFLVESSDGNTKSVISSNKNEIKINQTSPKAKNSTIKRYKFFDIYKWDYLSNLIGIFLSLGVFNRPTFLIFAFVPLLFWILHGLDNCNFKQTVTFITKRLLSIAKYFVPLSLFMVLFDTVYYYKIDTLNDLIYHVQNSKIVVTPFNFFLYNSKSSNLKEHGEHPFYQHFINCFLLFGLNHLILLFITFQFCLQFFLNQNTQDVDLSSVKSKLKRKILRLYIRIQSIYTQIMNNLFCYFILSFIIPLIVFSLVSHKEPRFLLPLIIPICLLTGHSLFGQNGSRILRIIWYIFNFLLVIVYGYLHQGGVLTSLNHVQKMFTHQSNLELDQHVIYYHTYMPPRYLVQAPFAQNFINNNKFLFEMKKNGVSLTEPVRKIYDLMSSSNKTILENLVFEIADLYKKGNGTSKSYAIFLVTPSVLEFELAMDESCYMTNENQNEHKSGGISYSLMTKFRFHITFEHLEDHLNYLKCKFKKLSDTSIKSKEYFVCQLNKCKKMDVFERIFNSFSLNLYQILL